MKHLLTYSIIFSLVCFAVGCSTPAEKLLMNTGYKFREPFKNCRTQAVEQCEYLKCLGYPTEVVHCDARSKYEWDHAICKAYIDGQWWVVPDGKVMDIPWEYNEVKKACYDYVLP